MYNRLFRNIRTYKRHILLLQEQIRDDVRIVGVQPALNEVIPGIRRIETGMKWYHWMDFDEVVDVKQVEAAINIARKEGLLIGLSAGAVVHAFTKIAKDDGVYILIFPDTGYKYADNLKILRKPTGNSEMKYVNHG